MDEKQIQVAWRSKYFDVTRNDKDKKRPSYLHFDVSPNFQSASKKVFNKHYIENHSFWPFIFYKAKAEKIKLLSDLLDKHSLTLPANLDNKSDLPKAVKDLIKEDPEISKAMISTKGNPHKYTTWKLRPICYASHLDSLIYSYYADLLNYDYEKLLTDKKLEDIVLAFRKGDGSKGKCNIDHSLKAFNDIQSYQRCVVLAFDVSSFFDILDHNIIKEKWLEVIRQSNNYAELPKHHFKVFKSITSYSYVDRDEVYDLFEISRHNPKNISRSIKKEIQYKTIPSYKVPVQQRGKRTRICSSSTFREVVRNKHLKVKKNLANKGIPQGSPMSGLLSNMYMIDFDVELSQYTQDNSGKYYRYCDDLLCIIPIKEYSEIKNVSRELEEFVYGLAQKYKLDVNEKKTEKFAFMPERLLDASYPDGTRKSASKLTNNISCAKITSDGLIYSRLQYLGFKFDGQNITIRSSSISRYQKKMKRGIKYHLQLKRKYDSSGTLKTQELRELYSHVGMTNFPAYAYRASSTMNSPAINKQMKNHQKELSFQIQAISKRINIAP